MNICSMARKVLIFGLLLVFSCAPVQSFREPDPGIQTHPDIVSGVLDNGFQYVLMENSFPEGQVGIHLNVSAGSIHETDEQQGVAHYLEHMVFNGSEHYKPGELIDYFQSIGMAFGADANAQTSFFNTVYDLSLPKGDAQHLEEAFVILQDYAEGALLLEAEVDRERGVILAEKRERDSISFRTFKKSLEFELPGSMLTKRFPIGIDTVINTANATLLRTFYDRWYRPDNMALIVVGDVDIPNVKKMIIKRFSKLKSRVLISKRPLSLQWPAHQGIKSFYYHEPEAGSTEVTIETVSWIPFEPETMDTLKKRSLNHIVTSILQNRLSRMVTLQTADFSEASVYFGPFLHHVSLASITATCKPDQWQPALHKIETTLRQGLLYGFTQKELDRAKADILSSLETRVNLAASQKTSELSRQILTTLHQKGLLLSPKQEKDFLEPYIESISLSDTHGALKEIWSKDHRLILVTGNADINTKNPQKTIFDVYQDSQNKTVYAYKGFESKSFPYLQVPITTNNEKSRKENVKGLGITSLDFQNNVRLNLKKTEFKKNEFLFKVCFGDGRKSEPISKPGLSFVSENVIESSGLGTLDFDQLAEALAGEKVEIGFQINETYFSLSGSADPQAAERVFQLIYHYFNDPGYRAEALHLAKIQYQQMYDTLQRTPEGIMQITGDRFLAQNDPRFGFPLSGVIQSYTLTDIKNWVDPYFKTAPVEISIVGDFDKKNMIMLASKYLGALKKRNHFSGQSFSCEKIMFPEGEQLELGIDTKIDSGVVHLAFPTDDFWDISQTRRLSVLSRILSEKLRLILREDLGESYSPYVYNNPSLRFDDYGVLHVVVNVKPNHHEFVFDKIKEIIFSITSKGISKKELDIALKPILNHLKILRKTNGYWLNAVMANAANYPQKFDWANSMIRDYTTITHMAVSQLAKKYLNITKSALIVIKPDNDHEI